MKCPSTNAVYALLLACFVPAVALEELTDGRSMGLIAGAGAIAVWAGVCSVLGRDSLVEEQADLGGPSAPRKKPALDANFYRATQGVAGVLVGATFVVLGVLAALGEIDLR